MSNYLISSIPFAKTTKICGIFLVLILTACGGSSDSNTDRVLTALTLTNAESSGSNCLWGGTRLSAGLDANSNGVLEGSEILSTQYICNGSLGVAGSSELSQLAAVTTEDPGSTCDEGGFKVSIGIDRNLNSILDESEKSSTEYLCQKIRNSDSVIPSELLALSTEAVGANCPNGGNKIYSGFDINADYVLNDTEITATRYSCNQAPGAGATWMNITDTSAIAQTNTGYLANNPASVTIALPASPLIGDIIQVSGKGTGGWLISQNAGQSILTKGMSASTNPAGAIWNPRETARQWNAIASSSDGNKLAAVVEGGQIYTSTDAGFTWIARESNRNWRSITSSSDGTKLAAVVQEGQIYTSTNSGITWTARDSNRSWWSITTSNDGTKLAAAVDGGLIYTSSDSGVTWVPQNSGSRTWRSITSSSNGEKLAAVVGLGNIYTSTDSGVTWTDSFSVGIANKTRWWGITSSSDGTKLAAAVWGSYIYTSTDSGATWTPRNEERAWFSITSSSDGTKLAAVTLLGKIYTSIDSGVTWTERESDRAWKSITSSSDGSQLAAVEYNGQIHTSVDGQTTVGIGGYLSGSQYDTVALQYIGGGLFVPLSYSIYSNTGILAF